MKIIDKGNNKGFTLIELLAVIVVLGVVTSIVIVVFSGSKDGAKVKLATINKENILKSSSYYIDEYNSTLVWSNSGSDKMACIPVKELINKGYFKEPEVEASGYLNSSVLVKENEKMVNSYEFSTDTNCGIVDTSVDLVLKGDNPLIKEYGTDFDLWSDIDIVLSNSMTLEKGISIDNGECSNTKSLKVGEYVAHYSVTTYGGASKTLDRNVKIVDTRAPVISFVTPIVKGVGEDFSLNSDVTYRDEAKYKDGEAILEDSKIISLNGEDIVNTMGLMAGEYVIRYEVSDRSGNVASRDREVSIIKSKWEFDYVGYEEEFVAPMNGYYYVDAKGAQSDYIADKGGGEVTGYIYLNKGDKLVVNVGGNNGYNGGGITSYDGYTVNGGGATTLKRGSETLITAGGGGRSGVSCFMTYTSSAPSSNTDFWSYSGDGNATCFIGVDDKATGGSGNGSGGANLGYGAGGNGTNGGGGAPGFAQTLVSNTCSNMKTETTYIEQQGACLVQDTTCFTIMGKKTCFPSGCKKYEIIKVPVVKQTCLEYRVIRQRKDDAGSGGSNSVSSSVKNYNLINGSVLGNGHLSISFVGDSYE